MFPWPVRRTLACMICKGWTNSPTTRSVVAKQASAMLDLVRSCRVVFTATITRMLSTMMRGQVRAFTTIRIMNTARTSREIFSEYIGKRGRPQLIIVRLAVVKFIFPRLMEWVNVSLPRVFRSLALLTSSLKWIQYLISLTVWPQKVTLIDENSIVYFCIQIMLN